MAATSQDPPELGHISKVKVTILASEWGSSKGGLSTINRELAIQLAKCPEADVTFFVPRCSEEDKQAALSHNITILQATQRPGYEEIDWLIIPPEHLQIDIIVGHGVKLGRQAQYIRDAKKCKWVQVVHTDPEELGMFKNYQDPISKGEEKHNVEVELCEIANYVVGVGPKLSEAFRRYLRWCKKDQAVFDLTPSIFDEFASVEQVPDEQKYPSILVFGRGDPEDFELKGFDIAGRAVAELPNTRLVFVGAPDGKHEEIAKRLIECGVPANRLRVRGFLKSRENLKRLFCEVDLVLMPSRTEGFGLTGLEALSAGLPVLVSKNSGFGEALSKVAFGSSFVVNSEDPKTWAAAIQNILDKDRIRRLEEATALRDSYKKKYSWDKQIDDLLDQMTKLVLDASSDGQSSAQEMFLSTAQASVQTEDTTEHRAADSSSDAQGSTQLKTGMKRKLTEHHAGTSSDGQSSTQTKSGKFSSQASQQIDNMTGHHSDVSYPTHIIDRIRQLYKRREGHHVPFPWCEDFSFNLEDIFTRLKIVNKQKTRGVLTDEITNMTGIFRAHAECQKPRIVLIEGEPGMGKTTYSQKLAYDWATKQDEWDESFPAIEVLIFLRCYDIKSSIWDAIDDQILPEDVNKEAKENFIKFIQENQSKVLLVLDGLDEADPSKLAMYNKLVESKDLPGCHIVITSRHEVGKKVRRYCDTLWDIVGFTEEDAKSFIRKYFQGMEHLADKLIKKLWPSPFHQSCPTEKLGDMTNNPLNTALLCILFEDFDGVLPTNRTELYIEIVLCVLRRYEKKNGLSCSGENLISVYRTELLLLGNLALESLLKGEYYFECHEESFKSTVPLKFGFLSIQPASTKRRPCMRCAFLHKSFQEFFAGFYLAFQILDKEISCASVMTNELYLYEMNQVFSYMSGIIALQSEETVLSLENSITAHINLLVRSSEDKAKLCMKLAFKFVWECSTLKKNLEPQLVDNLGKHLDLSSLTNLDLYGNGIGTVGASCISQALTVNSSLTNLDLCENSIGPAGASSVSQALATNSSLTNLNLSWNGIGDDGASFLSKAIKASSSLTHLDLRNNGIGAAGVSCIFQALAANSSLTNLDLSYNSISGDGVSCLSQALSANSSLTNLDLSYNSIGVDGAFFLSQTLTANSSLAHLNLSNNSIGVDGASSLSNALAANSSLTNLDLSENTIGDDGASFLSKALSANSFLTNLNLRKNSIRAAGASIISQALAANSFLTYLDLGMNSIGSVGASSLSQALKTNCSLTNLDLRCNSIDDDGVFSLSKALKANSSLTNLDLRGNSIGVDGASFLSNALAANSSLTYLNLSWNSIGIAGASFLSKALTANSSLTNLNLRGNSIGADGASSLSKALLANSSLTNLNLRGNSIGAKGVLFLSEALKINKTVNVRYDKD